MAPEPEEENVAPQENGVPQENSAPKENGFPLEIGLTMEEVAKHNTTDDCWMVIGNDATGGPKVYDVTAYLDDHPGGSEVLLDVGGQDADEFFEDIGHSNEARDELRKYLIAPLHETEEEKEKRRLAAENSKYGPGGGGGEMGNLAVVVAVIAAGYYYYKTTVLEEY